jgi:hypothetical protein
LLDGQGFSDVKTAGGRTTGIFNAAGNKEKD